MFSTELGLTLEAAFREASSRRHAFFCLEHLLYALSFDEQVMEVLQNVGVQWLCLTCTSSCATNSSLWRAQKHCLRRTLRRSPPLSKPLPMNGPMRLLSLTRTVGSAGGNWMTMRIGSRRDCRQTASAPVMRRRLPV